VSVTGEQWVLDEQGRYSCNRHPAIPKWERGEVCHACTSDPGEPVSALALAADDVEARAAEDELRSQSRTCLRTAQDLEDGTPIEKNLAVKYRESYLKHMRLWREMRTERLAVQRDADLVKHDKEMSGRRGSN
jgi:hypothetical protein